MLTVLDLGRRGGGPGGAKAVRPATGGTERAQSTDRYPAPLRTERSPEGDGGLRNVRGIPDHRRRAESDRNMTQIYLKSSKSISIIVFIC